MLKLKAFQGVLALNIIVLASCAGQIDRAPNQVIQNDLKNIYASTDSEKNTIKLSVYDAIERGLRTNLDSRIAQSDYEVSLSDAKLEYLNSLPTITARRDFISRDENTASRSVSADTGVESLESSISTEQYRWTSLLEANWSVLDSAINIYTSRSAVNRAAIAEQRLRKVRQNIVMDVYSAFWRVAAFQNVQPAVVSALGEADKRLSALGVAESNGDIPLEQLISVKGDILNKKQQLKNTYNGFKLAEYELKTLLSIPLQKQIVVKVDEGWLSTNSIPRLNKSVTAYVDDALDNRPEIKEELLELQISKRALNATLLNTLPGFELILGENGDSNRFLANNEWTSFTGAITQSVTEILTLPFRYQRAKRNIDLADSRRQALVAAAITQTHISKIIYDNSYDSYVDQTQIFKLSEKTYKRSRAYRDAGLLNGMEATSQNLAFQIARIERLQRYAQSQSDFARFMNTIGYDINEIGKAISVPQLSKFQDVRS